MGRHLCKLNGVGVMRKGSGRGSGVNKRAGRIGLVVVRVGSRREFETRLETGSCVWEQEGRTTAAGGERHRVREIGIVVSCGDSGERGWRTGFVSQLLRQRMQSVQAVRPTTNDNDLI